MRIRAEVAAAAAQLTAAGTTPHLAVVLATADESTAWYVRSIARAAERCGVRCSIVDLGPDATPVGIRAELDALSTDPAVHGIILQTPLPPNADFDSLASAIDPAKDIDGANPLSLGLLAAQLPAFAPATAEAVMVLLDHYAVPLSGANAVVIGRSTVVGKPVALLLIHRERHGHRVPPAHQESGRAHPTSRRTGRCRRPARTDHRRPRRPAHHRHRRRNQRHSGRRAGRRRRCRDGHRPRRRADPGPRRRRPGHHRAAAAAHPDIRQPVTRGRTKDAQYQLSR